MLDSQRLSMAEVRWSVLLLDRHVGKRRSRHRHESPGREHSTYCTRHPSFEAALTDGRLQAHVCGVSIIRSGEAMEAALRSCWKGIDIGKILVHRRHDTSHKSPPAAPPSEITPRSSPERHPHMHAQPSPIARDINGNYYRRNQCAP